MIDIEGLYSTLLTATFGGLPFAVIDTSQEVGRRVQRFLFPGVDDASYQDLGADDGPISLRGLLVGDDYIALMRSMMAVCRTPGPYTLHHPWLGNLQVIFVPGSRPKFSLAANELRVMRFEMQLYPYAPTAGAGLDTLSKLEVACDKLTVDAQNWLANAMAPIVGVLGAFGYVQSWLGSVANIFSQAIATTLSVGQIGPAAAAALADLVAPLTASFAGWNSTTAAAVMAVPAAIAGAASPEIPAAVAPGGTTTATAAADPADTVATLLAALPGIGTGANAATPGPALAAALQAGVVAAAVQAAGQISYASQQDAEAQAALLYAAMDAAIAAAGGAAVSDPKNAAPVWRDLVGLKAAFAEDLNALIGRLPAVVLIEIPRAMPAWIIAQYVSGDTPSQVYATYQDIITRNKVRHPALVPPGALEVLNQ